MVKIQEFKIKPGDLYILIPQDNIKIPSILECIHAKEIFMKSNSEYSILYDYYETYILTLQPQLFVESFKVKTAEKLKSYKIRNKVKNPEYIFDNKDKILENIENRFKNMKQKIINDFTNIIQPKVIEDDKTLRIGNTVSALTIEESSTETLSINFYRGTILEMSLNINNKVGINIDPIYRFNLLFDKNLITSKNNKTKNIKIEDIITVKNISMFMDKILNKIDVLYKNIMQNTTSILKFKEKT